jgi:penicillin-binding protein 1B
VTASTPGNWRRWLTGRLALGLGSIAAAGFIALVVYAIYLDRQIVAQWEGRRWDLPAQVYARPLELYEGLRIRSDELAGEFTALGYTAVAAPKSQGTWSRAGTRFNLVSRPFTFWDGQQASQGAIIRLGPAGIQKMTDLRGAPLAVLRLDPPFIGNIFTAHGEDRVIVRPEEVPPLLAEGLKVVEDRDFDTHFGVSPRAILRAVWANLRAGGVEQGGSTLTQQLVRSYFLSNERTLSRKLREALMSILLELHYTKEEILNAYVNEIYLGQAGDRAIHGFGLASRFYFGRPLTELAPEEVALLIAVVRGPSYYEPRRHPERARARRDRILDLMGEFQLLDADATRTAKRKAITVRDASASFASYNPSYMDLVRRELKKDYDEDDLGNAGLRIFTNLDPRIQARAEQELARGLKALEGGRTRPAGSLEGSVIVTGAQNGDIAAIVGGRNSRLQGFNRALDAKRPIGSLSKPFVYLAGFQSGRYHAASILADEPLRLKLDTGRVWEPKNYDKQYRGNVSLVRALAESLNTPTVRVGMDVGPRKVATLMQKLGLEKAPRPLPSLLLGAVALTPLEVAQLYNSLANGGFRTPVTAVRAVLDGNGEPLDRAELRLDRCADPAAVYQLNSSLEQVFQRGTARAARAWLPAGLVLAGKTGTSDELRDSWFAGFSGDHVAVVWVGADDNRSTGLSGASGALPIWARIMGSLGDASMQPVAAPAFEEQWFDFETGMLADGSCGDPVRLPLPAGTALELKPGCDPELLRNGPGVIQWFRDIFG